VLERDEKLDLGDGLGAVSGAISRRRSLSAFGFFVSVVCGAGGKPNGFAAKIYIVRMTLPALLKRYAKDFPEQANRWGVRNNASRGVVIHWVFPGLKTFSLRDSQQLNLAFTMK